MTSLATLIYLPRSISLFANGIFSGIAVTLNFVCVPAIKASKDPLPSFITTFNNASKMAVFSALVGTAANAVCYYRTNDTRFIHSALLSFSSFPFTVFFLHPVNLQLFALQKDGDDYDTKKAKNLVTKWNKLQHFRTITGLAAFLINILYKE
jgi:uncharacterized membrane protein